MSAQVLIIDAEVDFARSLVEALGSAGVTAEIASDGKVGLERARQLQPKVIVVCVELPQWSGYSVCTRLRKDELIRGVAVIITSSAATPETFESHRRLSTRADEYLKKPFAPERLLELVGRWIPLTTPSGEAEEVDIIDDITDAPELVADEDVFAPRAAVAQPNDTIALTSPGLRRGGSVSQAEAGAFLTAPVALRDDLGVEEVDEAEALTSIAASGELRGKPLPPPMPSTSRRSAPTGVPTAHADDLARGSQISGSTPRELLELKRERNAKEKELLGLKQQLQERDGEILAWRDREAELEEELVRLREGLEDGAARLDAAEAEREAEALAAQQTVTELRRRLGEQAAREDELTRTVQALGEELESLRGVVADQGAREAEAIAALEAELSRAKDRNLAQEAEQRDQVERARQEAAEHRRALEAQALENERALDTLEQTLRAEAEAARQALDAELEGVRAAHSQDIAALEEQLHASEERAAAAAEAARAEQSGIEAALEDARAQAERAVAELHQSREFHASTVAVAEQEQSALLVELGAAREERDRITLERDLLSAERDAVSIERDGLAQERDALAEARDTLGRDRDRLQTERDTLTAEVARLGSERSRIHNELSAALAEASGLRTKVREVHAELEASREAEKRSDALRAAEQRDREVLEALVDELHAERNKLDTLLGAAYERLRHEEAVRTKTLQALEIATALLREAGYSQDSTAPEGESAGNGGLGSVPPPA